MSKQFDVIVIGGGPGGYIAAIRAAQLGFQRGLYRRVEERARAARRPVAPAPTWAAFPSKALLQSSEHFEHANHHFADHGISAKDVKMDVAKMVARKDTVVKQNNDGILYLFKKNKVSFFHGRGSFVKAVDGGYEIKVAGAAEETLVGKQIIVATGSNARALPGAPFDEENILSNDGALRLGAVPKKLGADRLRRDRPGNGLGLASPGRRSHDPRSVCRPSWARWTSRSPRKRKKAFDKQGLKIELGVKVGEIKIRQEGRQCRLDQRQGRSPDAGRGQADRLDWPRAQHHRPER